MIQSKKWLSKFKLNHFYYSKDFFISDFKIIKDNYSIPKNIEYVGYNEIYKIEKFDNLYHPDLVSLTNSFKFNYSFG